MSATEALNVRVLTAHGDEQVGIPVTLKNPLHGFASILWVAVCTSPLLVAQQSPIAVPTIRVQSSLVLVDVITRDRKTGLPIRDFKRKDFRLFDNRREVPITTFDTEARY